ncbi:hypothetical protein BWQ96_10114 [Gracilariopsis chorda]|uniref:Uncharacterized protein n=1 Tax=Gracilariopsis chorda TaxID=448386 RepID=A0A2V3IDM1_9FLOR|nr:hypothetical protein BWQ96_10114 [Gracilariopsis chorda]|eukprot:PXF40176.1 hypothetical protein BWQ96_10114 [Gracilariopsis chorda]
MHAESVVTGIVAFSLFKKVTAYGLARYYGFPRIYRRLIMVNRALNSNPAQQVRMNEIVKQMFRLPNKAAGAVSRARLSFLGQRAKATKTTL